MHNESIDNAPESTMFQTLIALQQATLAARKRTGDDAIGTQVEAGKVQVVRVTYPNGKRKPAHVEPLSGFLSAADAVAFVNAL
jgi:hypothetical protein